MNSSPATWTVRERTPARRADAGADPSFTCSTVCSPPGRSRLGPSRLTPVWPELQLELAPSKISTLDHERVGRRCFLPAGYQAEAALLVPPAKEDPCPSQSREKGPPAPCSSLLPRRPTSPTRCGSSR